MEEALQVLLDGGDDSTTLEQATKHETRSTYIHAGDEDEDAYIPRSMAFYGL
jgi:hypothetical protein